MVLPGTRPFSKAANKSSLNPQREHLQQRPYCVHPTITEERGLISSLSLRCITKETVQKRLRNRHPVMLIPLNFQKQLLKQLGPFLFFGFFFWFVCLFVHFRMPPFSALNHSCCIHFFPLQLLRSAYLTTNLSSILGSSGKERACLFAARSSYLIIRACIHLLTQGQHPSWVFLASHIFLCLVSYSS